MADLEDDSEDEEPAAAAAASPPKVHRAGLGLCFCSLPPTDHVSCSEWDALDWQALCRKCTSERLADGLTVRTRHHLTPQPGSKPNLIGAPVHVQAVKAAGPASTAKARPAAAKSSSKAKARTALAT